MVEGIFLIILIIVVWRNDGWGGVWPWLLGSLVLMFVCSYVSSVIHRAGAMTPN